MTDERHHAPNSNDDPENAVENKLDSLLPPPRKGDQRKHSHDEIDGPEDLLLPVPDEQDPSTDDASTREELEVDTTADGVDDIIPLFEDERGSPASPSDDDEEASTCLACGERIGQVRFCPQCGTEQVPGHAFISRLAPLFRWSRPVSIRAGFTIGGVLVLLALLANSGTTALILSGSILPIVLLLGLAIHLDTRQRDTWIQTGMMILIGMAAGFPVAWLSTRTVHRTWFDSGVLNFGATSYGGVAAETAGWPPPMVWLTSGLLLPLVIILVLCSVPAALRLALGIPPRESTGMMLSASTATGYLIGSVAVFYWPLHLVIPPIMSTAEWTLTILGLSVVRPLVWVFSGAILGSVTWRYIGTGSIPEIAMPAATVVGLLIAYTLASLAVSRAGLWASIAVGVLFAAAAVVLYGRVLHRANVKGMSINPMANLGRP